MGKVQKTSLLSFLSIPSFFWEIGKKERLERKDKRLVFWTFSNVVFVISNLFYLRKVSRVLVISILLPANSYKYIKIY